MAQTPVRSGWNSVRSVEDDWHLEYPFIYIYIFSIYIAVTFYISPHSETQASARKEKKFTISVCRRLPSIVAPIPFFILGESSMPSPRRPSKVKEDRVYCREGNWREKKGLGYVEEVHFLFRYGRRSRWSGIEGARPDSDMGGCNRVRRHHSHLHPAGEGTSSHWRGETKK